MKTYKCLICNQKHNDYTAIKTGYGLMCPSCKTMHHLGNSVVIKATDEDEDEEYRPWYK